MKPPFVVLFPTVSAGAYVCRDGPLAVEVLCQDRLSGRAVPAEVESFLYQNN